MKQVGSRLKLNFCWANRPPPCQVLGFLACHNHNFDFILTVNNIRVGSRQFSNNTMKLIACIFAVCLLAYRGQCQADNFGVLQRQADGIAIKDADYKRRQAAIAREKADEQAAVLTELQKIYSKDPWRRIGMTTNLARGNGWSEFQGEVVEILSTGIVLKGKWGPIMTVNPTEENDVHLVRTQETEQSPGSVGTTQDTHFHRKVLYGDDLFFVDGFPYPAAVGQPFQEMMAVEGAYQTYTNRNKQVVTIPRLVYGTPCVKTLSQEEIAAMHKAADAPKLAVALKVFNDYETKAERGNPDPYALFRMGQYYRDGQEGIVVKDLHKARDYFERAEAAGYGDAANELKHLPLD